MSDVLLGLVISVIGICVTLLTIFILMLLIRLLNRLFPEKEISQEKNK